ncbi:MAG: zinc ABC transporter substrate-binding protein [Bacteroidota bacterium]
MTCKISSVLTSSSLICLIGFFILSCNSAKEEKTVPHIVTTTGMLYDAVLNITKGKMTIEALMGPGVDPHLYKATQGDLQKLNQADLVIYNGLQLEGKMTSILEKLSLQKPVANATENFPQNLLLTASGYQDAYDPHIWFDVSRWKHAVQATSEAIVQLDPSNGDYYNKNTVNYLQKLDSLDGHIEKKLKEIPAAQRILVTAHDAFNYFGDAYDIQVAALQGMSTVSDFGLKDIANAIDLITENNIKAIFAETSVSERSINAVVAGCREKGHDVVLGGSLYSDAMGAYGTEEGTYIGMFKKNIDTIVKALK